jgi:hypothetical protein
VSVTAPSIFGPLVGGSDLETWTVELVARWIGTYLSEAERQHGLAAGTLARPRAIVRTTSLDKWPEDQLPAVLVVSVGTMEQPVKGGDGSFRARWRIALGGLVSARTQEETRTMAMLYGLALRALLIQRPSLDGHAAGTVWTAETYDDLEYDDGRTLALAVEEFTVEVDGVTLADAGPVTPDDPLDPETDPWPDWPLAEQVEVEVDAVPPADLIEGGTT